MDHPYALDQSILQDTQSDINQLASDLRSRIRNHSYIDRIAAHSPNYRKSKIRSEYNRSIITSKNTIKYIPYEPGKFKLETSPRLKNILKENKQLKSFQIKNWLKKKVQFDKFKEPDANTEEGSSINVKKQYLMSDQQIKQDEIIEAIFTKFDSDGSGSLDINECIDLFRQNRIKLDKQTVKKLLGGDEFTLQKFKAIINSDSDLQRFKDVFGTQRGRILMDLEAEQHDNMNKQQEYVPFTFETLMESFGKKLQRKILFEEYIQSFSKIQKGLQKKKMLSKAELMEMVADTGEKMIKIIETSSVDPCQLKNNHNQLYLNLMQGLEYKKQKKEPMKKRIRTESYVIEEDPEDDDMIMNEDPKTFILKEVDRYLTEAKLRARQDFQASKLNTNATFQSIYKLDTSPGKSIMRQNMSPDTTSSKGGKISFQIDDPYEQGIKSQIIKPRDRMKSQQNIVISRGSSRFLYSRFSQSDHQKVKQMVQSRTHYGNTFGRRKFTQQPISKLPNLCFKVQEQQTRKNIQILKMCEEDNLKKINFKGKVGLRYQMNTGRKIQQKVQQ